MTCIMTWRARRGGGGLNVTQMVCERLLGNMDACMEAIPKATTYTEDRRLTERKSSMLCNENAKNILELFQNYIFRIKIF